MGALTATRGHLGLRMADQRRRDGSRQRRSAARRLLRSSRAHYLPRPRRRRFVAARLLRHQGHQTVRAHSLIGTSARRRRRLAETAQRADRGRPVRLSSPMLTLGVGWVSEAQIVAAGTNARGSDEDIDQLGKDEPGRMRCGASPLRIRRQAQRSSASDEWFRSSVGMAGTQSRHVVATSGPAYQPRSRRQARLPGGHPCLNCRLAGSRSVR
jgi:hypothetical protein